MQLIETPVGQRSQLPLPSAALVIDVRGVQDDEVIEWLRIELEDLASEMKAYNLYHWRYLTDFLSVMRIHPMQDEGQQNGDQKTSSPTEFVGLTGIVHPSAPDSADFHEEREDLGVEDMPFNHFEQHIDELILEIDRIRNNRIAAVKDLNNAAIPGRSSRDSTVRVLFLTDIRSPESLSTASLYAERLKSYYNKLEKQGHQQLLNTTVLCLSNSGEAGTSSTLIQKLTRNNNWEHLDSLILSENYREDAAQIAGPIQSYIAELLLYVLLIVPPLPVSVAASDMTKASQNGTQEDGTLRELGLPENTFIVGLAALEYSARWGRRWLNFGLAKEATNVLRQKLPNSNKEKIRQGDIASSWFQDWRNRVRQAIPDDVPDVIPALEGIHNARSVSDSTKQPFTTTHFYLHIGDSTVSDLEAFLSKLTQTYVQSGTRSALQDSLSQSTLQVMQKLQEKEQQGQEERSTSRIGKLQIEAEQILKHPKFFVGATSSVPRAQMQLQAVGETLARFSQEHQSHPLNPKAMKETLRYRQQELEENGQKRIEQLKKHLSHWPFVAGTTFTKLLLGGLALALLLFMTVVAIFAGFAWLHHALALHLPSFLVSLDTILFGLPLMEFIAGVLTLIVLTIEVALFWPILINKDRSALYIEITFVVMLIAFMLLGLLISYSFGSLVNTFDDPTSIRYILWLAFVPGLGIICGILALVLVIGELLYSIWWLNYLLQERQRIVVALRKQHRQDIKDVTDFIADDIAMELVLLAELTDGNGGLGKYYYRVAHVCALLDDIAEKARYQQELASKRLLLSQSQAQQGLYNPMGESNGSTWLDLHIRDEKMELEKLTEAFKDLKQHIVKESPEMRNLAEFVLRMQGIEKAVDVGREEQFNQQDSDIYRLQTFVQALVAITLRFCIEPLSIENIEQLKAHYQDTYDYAWQEIPSLNTLIRSLIKQNSQITFQSMTERNENGHLSRLSSANSNIAVSTLAILGQLFWQHQHHELDQILMQDGVLAHLQQLMQEDYDPRAIMRRLLAFTVFLGRSSQVNQGGDLYLLLAPTPQSYHFNNTFKRSTRPMIIEFPDVERILLLGVKRFVAEPKPLLALKKEEQGKLPAPTDAIDTSAISIQSVPSAIEQRAPIAADTTTK